MTATNSARSVGLVVLQKIHSLLDSAAEVRLFHNQSRLKDSLQHYRAALVLQKPTQSAEGHERLFLKRSSGTAKRRTSPDPVHHSLLIF